MSFNKVLLPPIHTSPSHRKISLYPVIPHVLSLILSSPLFPPTPPTQCKQGEQIPLPACYWCYLMYIRTGKHRVAYSLIGVCPSLLFTHPVTEIGRQPEPRWNSRNIFSNAWCPVIVLPAKTVAQQSTSVCVLCVILIECSVYSNKPRPLEQTQKIARLATEVMLCIFLNLLTVIIGYSGKDMHRTPTRSDPRMQRLDPVHVAEQWVINRSGWALLVLTEVFHKQRRMAWGAGGELIICGEKSALLF